MLVVALFTEVGKYRIIKTSPILPGAVRKDFQRVMANLTKILDGVIRRGFPELLREDIRIEFLNLHDSLLSYGELTHEGFYIEVDKTLRDAPENVFIGGIAHECAHIVVDMSKGRKALSGDALAYRISSRYKTLDERNTDLEVILRGFGQELLHFLRYSEQLGLDHYREDGLSIREIEILLGESDDV